AGGDGALLEVFTRPFAQSLRVGQRMRLVVLVFVGVHGASRGGTASQSRPRANPSEPGELHAQIPQPALDLGVLGLAAGFDLFAVGEELPADGRDLVRAG